MDPEGSRSAGNDPRSPTIRVDFNRSAGDRVDRGLLGACVCGYIYQANASLPAREVPVTSIRVGATLERVWPKRGTFEPGPLDARLANITANGAEPVLFLGYMPTWLAGCDDASADPRWRTRCPPQDHETFHRILERTIEYAAQRGVTTFEVWNEPDNPYFFHGTFADYLRIYETANEALRDAEADLGRDLEIGGPTTVGPDPAWIQGLLEFVRARGLDLDVVSWHWYANYPFFGPFPTGQTPWPRDEFRFANYESPATDPEQFGAQIELVRSWVASARAQGLDDRPRLRISEWNVNAGPDPRHRTHEGAAFAAATLVEMTQAGLDAANYAKLQSDGLGIWDEAGEPHPVKRALEFYGDLPRLRFPAEVPASEPGLHALAARHAGEAGVLVATYHENTAGTMDLRLVLEGAPSGDLRLRTVTGPDQAVTVESVNRTDAATEVRLEIPTRAVLHLTVDG